VFYCDLPEKREPPAIDFLTKKRLEYWAIDCDGYFYLAGYKNKPTKNDWSITTIFGSIK
jgi:hypothetical protein